MRDHSADTEATLLAMSITIEHDVPTLQTVLIKTAFAGRRRARRVSW
jgi:hypothetical protein